MDVASKLTVEFRHVTMHEVATYCQIDPVGISHFVHASDRQNPQSSAMLAVILAVIKHRHLATRSTSRHRAYPLRFTCASQIYRRAVHGTAGRLSPIT